MARGRFHAPLFDPRNLPLLGILLYQIVISPLKRPSCRYYPSCSEYAFLMFSHDGILRAISLSLWRILRCNPFFNGGIDYPVIYRRISPVFATPRPILLWLVPVRQHKSWSEKMEFYLIKSLNH